MKILLLFCLIKYFLFKNYDLKRYESIIVILNDSGYIILNISNFSPGDSIYLTFKSINGEYFNFVDYTFSSSYPKKNINLDQINYAYSEDYNKRENLISTRREILFDYFYYFEFIKSQNEQNYLIMDFSQLTSKNSVLLQVENTRYRRNAVIMIVVNIIAVIIFITLLIIFIIKYPCWKTSSKELIDDKDFNTSIENNNNLNEEITYPSSMTTNYGFNEVKEKQNQNNKIYNNDTPMNCSPFPD